MNRTLIVMGDDPCLENDLRAVYIPDADFMAVNRAGIRIPEPLTWWATYHPATFWKERWAALRAEIFGNEDYTVVCHERHAGLERQVRNAPHVVSGPRLTGSSSLFGVLFGLELGYLEIIVAGAPLTHPDYAYFHDGWRLQADVLAGRVRSLSGWTKTFLEGL